MGANVTYHKSGTYANLSLYHVKDKSMSLKAKGMLTIMLTLPENWEYSITGLATLSDDGVEATRNAVRELERLGYVRRTQMRDESGTISGAFYDIYETPTFNQPSAGNLSKDMCAQSIIDKSIIDKSNNIPPLSPKGENKTGRVTAGDVEESISEFDEDVQEAVRNWIQYKKEKGDSYKPTGFKALITQISKQVKLIGKTAVVNQITQAMANGWKGINFETATRPGYASVAPKNEQRKIPDRWKECGYFDDAD